MHERVGIYYFHAGSDSVQSIHVVIIIINCKRHSQIPTRASIHVCLCLPTKEWSWYEDGWATCGRERGSEVKKRYVPHESGSVDTHRGVLNPRFAVSEHFLKRKREQCYYINGA